MKTLFALSLLALAVLLGGCTPMDEDESAVPWGAPANWENRIPGMPDQGQGL